MKTCPKCDSTKPADFFYKNFRNRDGLGSYCKSCHKAGNRAAKRLTRTGTKVVTRECEICGTEFSWERRAGRPITYCSPECLTAIRRNTAQRQRLTSYGLTKESFSGLLEAQDYCCAICSAWIDTSAHIDHCHDTGAVRGILCNNCNTGIGFLGDTIESLQRALEYLERSAVR